MLTAFAQDLQLQSGQFLQFGKIFVTDIRFLPDDAQAGTGNVRNDAVHAFLPFGTEGSGILAQSRNIRQPQTCSTVADQLHLMFMDIAGGNAAPAPP